MADAGRSDLVDSQAEFWAEFGERKRLLRELSLQLDSPENAAVALVALRHRLHTLCVAATSVEDPAVVEALAPLGAQLTELDAHETAALAKFAQGLQAALERVALNRDRLNENKGPKTVSTIGLTSTKHQSEIVTEDADPRVSSLIAARAGESSPVLGTTAPSQRGDDPFFDSLTPETVDAAEATETTLDGSQGLMLSQTVSGLVAAPKPAVVFVIDDEATVHRVRKSLSDEHFEVSGMANVEEALSLLPALLPEVVLVSECHAQDANLQLVDRIRKDPKTRVRNVLLLAHRATQETAARLGCDAWVRKPVEGPLLQALLERLGSGVASDSNSLSGLTEGTIDDIAQRFAEEIRRGLSESMNIGRDERIELADNSELVAAAWTAIGRVRSHLSQRTLGKVRFAEGSEDGNALLDSPTDEADGQAESVAGLVRGRRILIADDDPAVLWFFAGLLREAGAEVLEAKNGREALELARLRRPHLIVSDILMPKIDGFALCRELSRDLAMWDVPIILLSWKDDYLLRMRELQSGAAGYLRKESGSRHILTTLADALRARAQLRSQIASNADVYGRLDGVSVLSMIELVARHRPDAQLTIRDAYNIYEIQMRGGEQLRVTRTASDGSFSRGSRALEQALGVRSGKFSVCLAEGVLRGGAQEPLAVELQRAARQMGALLDAVSDKRLLRIGQVELDDDLVGALAEVTPASLTEFLTELREPSTPLRERLLSGELVPQMVEEHLRELARTGAITAVWDTEGVDLIAEALAEISADPGRLLHVSIAPSSPGMMSGAPVTQEQESAVESSEGAGPRRERRDTAPDQASGPPAASSADIALAELAGAPPDAGFLATAGVGIELNSSLEETSVPARDSSVQQVTSNGGDAALADVATQTEADERAARSQTGQALDAGVRPRRETEVMSVRSSMSTADVLGDEREELLAKAEADVEAAKGTDLEEWDAGGTAADGVEAMEPGPDLVSRVAVLASFAALAALGYFGFKALGINQLMVRDRIETVGSQSAPQVANAPQADVSVTTSRSSASKPGSTVPDSVGGNLKAQGASTQVLDRILPFVDAAHGVDVKAEEGLLVVNLPSEGAVRVRVGARDFGVAPVAVALKQGRHELILTRDGHTKFRHLKIRQGHTHVVEAP